MELFDFFRGLLAWMATVAILWPVNVPMAAFAYKVRLGSTPLDIEKDELWTRSAFATLVLALATVGFVVLDWMIVDGIDFPPGPVHLFMVMAYVPVGTWIMTLFFGYSDLLDGLSTFTIYIVLPVLALWLVNRVVGIWNPLLSVAYDWLKAIEA